LQFVVSNGKFNLGHICRNRFHLWTWGQANSSICLNEEEPRNQRHAGFQQGFFMAFGVYILLSESTGRYYCGQSQILETGLIQHNDPSNNLSRTTQKFQGPWNLVGSKEMQNGSESVRLEGQIKKRGIGRVLQEQNGGC
jgi:putative endonuclease